MLKRFFTFGLVMVVGFVLSGCSSVMALRQPEKKNLSVLSAGTSRENVISYLGAPAVSKAEEGQNADIFQFKQGYSGGNKAGRALFHGVADVFTFFIWELVAIPGEVVFNGTDMSVKVVYDDQNKVKDVIYLKGKP